MDLPVGFERFHRRDFVNYQLNRAYVLGFADRAELTVRGDPRTVGAGLCSRVRKRLSAGDRRSRIRQATGYL